MNFFAACITIHSQPVTTEAALSCVQFMATMTRLGRAMLAEAAGKGMMGKLVMHERYLMLPGWPVWGEYGTCNKATGTGA
jgi:hypothetical protein